MKPATGWVAAVATVTLIGASSTAAVAPFAPAWSQAADVSPRKRAVNRIMRRGTSGAGIRGGGAAQELIDVLTGEGLRVGHHRQVGVDGAHVPPQDQRADE